MMMMMMLVTNSMTICIFFKIDKMLPEMMKMSGYGILLVQFVFVNQIHQERGNLSNAVRNTEWQFTKKKKYKI